MDRLEVSDLEFSIDDKKIIDNINLCVKENKFVGLIGPNGCGKSTLLKNIYRLYKPHKGAIYLNGTNIEKIKNKEIAKNMSVVSQENNHQFDFTVKEIVLMGRYAHKGLLDSNTEKDEEIAFDSLERVGLKDFYDRSFLSLSGGEKQRVLIARALTQNAKTIILDEPTNHLDIKYQLQIMDVIKSLKVTTFAAIHDFNIASNYCDYIYVMEKGKIKYFGTPEKVLTKKIFEEVFGVKSHISKNPFTNKIHISFYSDCYNPV
ncbi:ABC transporter ATP-binding protein [Anaeromicrobium sediminis]|uniref:ABC transporter n=1 Tax=Anaeromicrobium sediminis TaxID=1478221 RepID=A0A267M9G6_9FIRM|nr:ABC transporter ATP-binding protein [Anaeromicrobium sediminis]PAB56209.1 ABC transporter [Anaeromicrobium sediminis]